MLLAICLVVERNALTVLQSSTTFVDMLSRKSWRHPRPAADVMINMRDVGKQAGHELDATGSIAYDGNLLVLCSC